jgi:hypothetical protein
MTMKKITAFFIALTLPIAMHASSEQGDSNQIDSAKLEKIYISSNHLLFDNTDMYAYLNDNWVQVNAVYSDDEGLFVECKQPNPTCWYCPDCRTYHSDSMPCPYKKEDKKDRESKEKKRDKEDKKQKKHR